MVAKNHGYKVQAWLRGLTIAMPRTRPSAMTTLALHPGATAMSHCVPSKIRARFGTLTGGWASLLLIHAPMKPPLLLRMRQPGTASGGASVWDAAHSDCGHPAHVAVGPRRRFDEARLAAEGAAVDRVTDASAGLGGGEEYHGYARSCLSSTATMYWLVDVTLLPRLHCSACSVHASPLFAPVLFRLVGRMRPCIRRPASRYGDKQPPAFQPSTRSSLRSGCTGFHRGDESCCR